MLSSEVQYFILLSALLLLPKVLLRYKIPSALTAMAIGVVVTLSLGWFQGDGTVTLMATMGITSLFLFAGMEVDVDELRRDGLVLLKHVGKSSAFIAIAAIALFYVFELSVREALVLSLGLMTPSTGFILNSLDSFDFSDEQRYWIRLKAISQELIVLIILFIVLQSKSWQVLSVSSAGILAMIFFLPILFRFFLKKVAPFAPDSEVAFLILTALLCGVITRKIGAYYLVGAFIVGIVAGRFKHFMDSSKSATIFASVGFFFSFFIPFYFFQAGMNFASLALSWDGAILGLIFLAVFAPLRYFATVLSIKLFLPEFWKDRFEISLSLMPTLIFALVVATVLREQFDTDPVIIGGLMTYTVLSSALPALFLKKAPPEEYNLTRHRGSLS